MLKELMPRCYTFDFGGAAIYMRYDLNALLEAERGGVMWDNSLTNDYSGAELALFFRAGIIGEEIKKRAEGIISSLGERVVCEHCRRALLLSLPDYDPLVIPKNNGKNEPLSFVRLRACVCDVIGKSEEFFMRSTIGELLERWQEYAIVMGYAEKPERVELYDTEGME